MNFKRVFVLLSCWDVCFCPVGMYLSCCAVGMYVFVLLGCMFLSCCAVGMYLFLSCWDIKI